MPERIQRQRTKGWRMPEGAVYVGRPTKYGNPFAVYRGACTVIGRPWSTIREQPLTAGVWIYRHGDDVAYTTHSSVEAAVEHSIDLFHTYCEVTQRDTPDEFAAWLAPLRGRDLACWCALSAPCHVPVLLELANQEVPVRG